MILGSHNAERLTIFSFVIKHEETGKFVHYNFISTLLNDLFGLQSRGGCACAGPYGHVSFQHKERVFFKSGPVLAINEGGKS